MPLVMRRSFTAHPAYRIFTVSDPTCDELSNFETAFSDLGSGLFGWGPNAIVVNTLIDPGVATVMVEVWSEPASVEGAPSAVAESSLALPGGRLGCLQALEDDVQIGLSLPAGPGTYGVRMAAYNRGVVARYDSVRSSDSGATSERPFPGTFESYRMQLWHLSDEPRWEDDEE
ncbi:hypothetical protein [Actinoplanes auranticolor]|uniref:Uncharacterized protein n=1 Tax=Actinoplanes auranticolor TaxID=47988 RepID=A0A919SQF6_9ACTN|nr:hypothetical protein [Actinoplanes auranticolor]GIM74943.1 hypothetical protein Aau02nite_63430 [Actinoplanes auranticolor]